MHTFIGRVGSAIPALVLLYGSAAWADVQQTSPVVVTATRTAQAVDESLAAVSVITRSQIERSGAHDVMELLRLENGVDVARGGGPGQQTSVFLRGTNSNHVLVLIDGVRAASATTGAFAWTHLSASQIERIEIVRGPRASLYGSDAIGGVIHIFTRKPDTWSATAEAGSFGTRNFGTALAIGDKRRLTVNLENRHTDGYSSQNSNGFSFDPDNDGYDNSSITAGIVYPIGDDLEFDFGAWSSKGKTEFDDGVLDSLNQTFSLAIKTRATDIWSHTVRIGFIQDDLDTRSAFPSKTDTHRRMIEWQNDISVGDTALLTLGLSLVRDTAVNLDVVSATNVFDEFTSDRAVFAGWQSAFGKNDYQLSLRADDHLNAGNKTTGNIAWGRLLTDDLRVFASYGTAFRSPTINELFHPGYGGFFAGNPSLKPESSATAEAGARLAVTPSSQVELSLYRTDVDDLIVFHGTNSQAINLDQANITGAEAAYRFTGGPWMLYTGVTLQQARDQATDAPLLRRPDRKLAVRASRDLGAKTYLSAELAANSERQDIGNVTLPGYGLLNLSVGHRISDELKISARMENVLDKTYELASGFNTAERSAYVELNYQAK